MMAEEHAKPQRICILGTRGIPAKHGGFETFAEHLALYLVERGWDVTVYCQDGAEQLKREELWRGVRLIHIPSGDDSPLATISFDLRSVLDAARRDSLVLTLGYNTALFLLWFKVFGVVNLINMDGIEWKRTKWSFPARCWLYANERMASWFANHLIADHPSIKKHHARHVAEDRISMIPYGAAKVESGGTDTLKQFGLTERGYVLLVARAEPENSILEIVQAFTARPRSCKLVVVGNYFPDRSQYHKEVLAACNDQVLMMGPEYNHERLNQLRFNARLYVHGHQVGGTNPSLVEALGSSNPVLAHSNPFNQWVAGESNMYFSSREECEQMFDTILDDDRKLDQMRAGSIKRHLDAFQWADILSQYEQLLATWSRSPVSTYRLPSAT